jgi:hypothetical protein
MRSLFSRDCPLPWTLWGLFPGAGGTGPSGLAGPVRSCAGRHLTLEQLRHSMPLHLSRPRYEAFPRCRSCGWFYHSFLRNSVELWVVLIVVSFCGGEVVNIPACFSGGPHAASVGARGELARRISGGAASGLVFRPRRGWFPFLLVDWFWREYSFCNLHSVDTLKC